MKKRKKTLAAMGLGVPSLLTVLAVLLLASFAAMAYLTAKTDLRLTQQAAASLRAYYVADCAAEEWWMGLNETLNSKGGEAANKALLDAGYSMEEQEAGLRVWSAFPINDKKELEVEAFVTTAGQAKIVKWQSTAAY